MKGKRVRVRNDGAIRLCTRVRVRRLIERGCRMREAVGKYAVRYLYHATTIMLYHDRV